MKIAAVQFSGFPGDVQKNLHAICQAAETGAEAGCRLLLFPEIADIGYDLQAVSTHGHSSWPNVSDTLRNLSCRLGLALVCGVCLPGPKGLANALVAFGPEGQILGQYRKTHLFRTREMDETRVFTPGDTLVSFELDGFTFGMSVCYDLRFPELYRVQTLEGCHVLLVASAWPRARINVWRALSVARAVENQCYLLGANRVGEIGAFPFGGHSVFVTPTGEVAMADDHTEGLTSGNISLHELNTVRKNIPALFHRRPELYGKVLDTLTLGL